MQAAHRPVHARARARSSGAPATPTSSRSAAVALALALVLVPLASTTASARELSAWGPASDVESAAGTSRDVNTDALEGCPILSPDGLELWMASDRAGGLGGIDIWVARRASADAPWGAPENVGAPINSPADDFCPSPARGNRFFFVSTRTVEGACGGADLYATRQHPHGGWVEPVNLGCEVNSAGAEFSPSYVEDDSGQASLWFSSNRPGGFAPEGGAAPDHDVYVSTVPIDGTFGAPHLVDGVNTAADDARPNVRRDGLEIVFDSNRVGGRGGFDVYAATREHAGAPWSAPANLGGAVNSPAMETRPSLSWDGLVLHVGSTRAGSSDIYASSRTMLVGRR